MFDNMNYSLYNEIMLNLNILARKEADKEQTLTEHLNNTANLCVKYNAILNTPLISELIGKLHDLGKATQAFQDKLNGKDSHVEHAILPTIFLLKLSLTYNDQRLLIIQIIAMVIMCHHTGLRNMVDYYSPVFNNVIHRIDNKSKNHSEKVAQNYYEMINNCQSELKKIEVILGSDSFLNECKTIIENLIKYSSTEIDENSVKINKFNLGMFLRFNYSALIDADRTDASNFCNYTQNVADIDRKKLFVKIINYMDTLSKTYPKNALNDIRAHIYNKCIEKSQEGTGIYELNVPTGGGKTLSSFRFALGNAVKNNLKHIIYVVPYISIIDQNAKVIGDILSALGLEDYLVESHSNAVHYKEYTENCNNSKFNKFFTSWDEPVVFTTMVSFLESVYAAKTQNNRRFHNMAEAIIIFDEVQALPINCIGLFNLLIKFLHKFLNTSIVLCTATQPTLSCLAAYYENKNSIKMLELQKTIKIIDEDFPQLDRTDFILDDDHEMDKEQAVNYILEKFIDVNNLLVIVNTKNAARSLFLELKKHTLCYHLSTNMCAQHRLDIIDKVKKEIYNKNKFILISTQLIEAGVDVDFECVIRSRCGLDSLIQSAGRCNREYKLKDSKGNLIKGKVYVIHLEETLENLHTLMYLKETQNYYLDCKEKIKNNISCKINDNEIIEFYFKNLYNKKEILKYKIGSENAVDLLIIGDSCIDNDYQKFDTLNFAFKKVADHFKVIDNGEQIGILVPYKEGERLIKNLKNLNSKEAKISQRYFVNVYSNNLKNYSNLQNKEGILYIENGYDPELGLTQEIHAVCFEGGILC